ncbi:acyl-CoA dehydrogenase family protein [Emcibacter nanhaiensis]|uniref:Acyl-[acyl-carrier-protein] dehydrogenase MbtN n=1 Tax=Emcibacter nanhaiensis TaxID=1505037 RepID=A0A501PGU5_9PROT|nr:acyl-CoA dehydrogenase family protein [Emcibacter nanhaiensis]TPD59297.1 acyl-CoA dehydrogenase [Emcibacter nanhaiensis]
MIFRYASWMTDELSILADITRKFFQTEFLPYVERFHAKKKVDREFWEKAGEYGILAASIPEEFGGAGGNLSHDSVIFGELGYTGDMSFGLFVHNIAVHYVLAYATEEQKQRWLPKLASGELIGAIAMTEPGTGSDLQGVRTSAVRSGGEYVINGSKTFISNGQISNFIILVVKTDMNHGAKGISLVGIETDGLDGFRRGRNLDKLGMPGQDTSELFFDDAQVSAHNLLGGIAGQGFGQLMKQLAWERLMLGIIAVGASQKAIEETVSYTAERHAFGKPVLEFQNSRFKLAECKAKLELLRAYVEKCIGKILCGELGAEEASIAKLTGSEIQGEILDECVQLHGGYGYMREYLVARMYADARVQRIYGGTSEIMKELISRSLMS